LGNTSTTVPSGLGIGIRIRTTGLPPNDLTQSPSNNINIDHCIFNGMTVGIDNQGTLNKFNIKNNEFNWLGLGVKSMNTATTVAGINGIIDNNKFQNIGSQGILIGTNTNVVSSYITSSNNSFRDVGCNYQGENNQVTSVITFNDLGCQSINDFFDRQVSTPNNYYMYPWVSGNATVSSGATYVVSVPSLSTTNIINIPLAKTNQLVSVNYTLSNVSMQRTGQLNINISTATTGFASVSDNYNYIEYTNQYVSDLLSFSTDTGKSDRSINSGTSFRNYITLTCISRFQNSSTKLEYNINFLN
jgi:hypothetical protein